MREAFLLLFAASLLHSATLSGSIYSCDDIEKLNNTMLRFEGAASYQTVSPDGDYSIDLQPGDYVLTASYSEDGSLLYYANDNLSVGDGNQTYDVVMFPASFFEDDELPDLGVDIPDKPAPESADWPGIPLALALLLLASIALYVLAKKYFQARAPGTEEPKKELDEDGKAVLKLLVENEGRMEQKQMREILGHSESKMSLLLTELEVTGMIKRFKKGRENIVKLKKGL